MPGNFAFRGKNYVKIQALSQQRSVLRRETREIPEIISVVLTRKIKTHC